jgi:hypothetical protein
MIADRPKRNPGTGWRAHAACARPEKPMGAVHDGDRPKVHRWSSALMVKRWGA